MKTLIVALTLLIFAGCAPDVEIDTTVGEISGLYRVNLREIENSCDETSLDRNYNLWVTVQEYLEDGGYIVDIELGDEEIVWEDVEVSASGNFDAVHTVGWALVDSLYGNISNGRITGRLETEVNSIWDDTPICSLIYEVTGKYRAEPQEPPEWWLEN